MRVFLEVAAGRAGVVAHAPAAPGLTGIGTSETGALRDLARAARFYSGVLRRRGLDVSRLESGVRWMPAGRVAGGSLWRSGSEAALLPTDLAAPSDRRVRATMRIVRALRADLLDRVARLGPRRYARPPRRGARSPQQTLDHLADCEWWYCSRLDDRLPEPGRDCPRETHARLEHLLAFAEAYLLGLSPARRRRVVVPRRFPTRDRAEKWTAGKVLRRLAEHEFEHLRAAAGWRPPS